MRFARVVSFLLLASFCVFAADDQSKAEKQIAKITAMAADLTGRRAVNQSMSEQFSVKKSDLVQQRRELNCNYGCLFLVRELIASGVSVDDINKQFKAGKSAPAAANELKANWKQIASDAKKLNSKIEDNLYAFFVGRKGEKEAADATDVYDATMDGVSSDTSVSQQDLADAQDRYLFWRNRANLALEKKDGTLTHDKEQAARQTFDPVRKGGPQSESVGNTGPNASGTPH